VGRLYEVRARKTMSNPSLGWFGRKTQEWKRKIKNGRWGCLHWIL